MNEINEIKIPKGVESISVTQHDDKIVIEFIPKKPQFKNGDFVYEDGRIMIINKFSERSTTYHALIFPAFDLDVVYNDTYAPSNLLSPLNFRLAIGEEKQLLIDAMEKDGKRWSAEKLTVENIPQPKFKVGDEVMIKEGVSSKTHRYAAYSFVEGMDKYIGKKLIITHVLDLDRNGVVYTMTNDSYYYHEAWLEPYTEELKKGDLAIFWDNDKARAVIKIYDMKIYDFHYDSFGNIWLNAIKFESKEQFEKILNGKF